MTCYCHVVTHTLPSSGEPYSQSQSPAVQSTCSICSGKLRLARPWVPTVLLEYLPFPEYLEPKAYIVYTWAFFLCHVEYLPSSTVLDYPCLLPDIQLLKYNLFCCLPALRLMPLKPNKQTIVESVLAVPGLPLSQQVLVRFRTLGSYRVCLAFISCSF